MNPNDYLWEIKYRPDTIKDCILPKENKDDFLRMVESGDISNLLLVSSKPGTGKTTVARALCNDLDLDYLFINASENGGIGELRTTIRKYVSSFSFEGKSKVVIMDEFDQASGDFQKAFRGFVEEFPNARFILTANYFNKVIEPIRSRMNVYVFTHSDDERNKLIIESVKRCQYILEKENIPCTNVKILMEVVRKNFPDNRATLVELQRYARRGSIDEGILGIVVGNDDLSLLMGYIKDKNLKEIRAIVPKYASDYSNFIRHLYNICYTNVKPICVLDMISFIGENMKYASQVPDMEIHLMALMADLIRDVEWK